MANVVNRRAKLAVVAAVVLTVLYIVAIYTIQGSPKGKVVRGEEQASERIAFSVLFGGKETDFGVPGINANGSDFRAAVRNVAEGDRKNDFELSKEENQSLDEIKKLFNGDKFSKGEVSEVLGDLQSGGNTRLDVVSYAILKRNGALSDEFVESNIKYYEGIKSLGIRLSEKDFVEFSLDIFNVLSNLYDDKFVDPEVIAWKGSSICKQALYVDSSLQKIERVNEGTAILDSVVYDYPDYVVARYVRASTYLNLPSIFKKKEMLLDDIEYLVSSFVNENRVKRVDGYGDISVMQMEDVEPLKKLIDSAKDVLSDRKGLLDMVGSIKDSKIKILKE